MYHGTSWDNAVEIERDGFVRSESGQLGPGVYVARYDKACKFARSLNWHGGDSAGLVEVIISFRYPKYVSYGDRHWQYQGYDACRTDETPLSSNMEWCVRDPDQVRVVDIWQIDVDEYDSDDDDADEEELAEHGVNM